jgi:hypothetical protein
LRESSRLLEELGSEERKHLLTDLVVKYASLFLGVGTTEAPRRGQ